MNNLWSVEGLHYLQCLYTLISIEEIRSYEVLVKLVRCQLIVLDGKGSPFRWRFNRWRLTLKTLKCQGNGNQNVAKKGELAFEQQIFNYSSVWAAMFSQRTSIDTTSLGYSYEIKQCPLQATQQHNIKYN